MRWTRKDRARVRERCAQRSRLFVLTLLYALFYLIGAAVGYSRSGSFLCLGVSGGLGLLLMLVGVGHAIDHYRAAPIELIYTTIPFVCSFFIAVFMSCIYGMGSTFHTSGFVAIVAWLATAVYFYAIAQPYFAGHLVASDRTQFSPMHIGAR